MPSRHSEIAPCKGIQIPECLWIPEFYRLWNPEFPQKVGIQNPSSTDKDWNPPLQSGIHSVESRIQDCPGFPYVGRQKDVGLKRQRFVRTPLQSDLKSNNMRCREWNPTSDQTEIIRLPLYMQLFNLNWPLNHKSLKDKMCGLNVVCSRGGSGETSKTRRCVGLAIQRSLITVHKSFFSSPIFRSSPGQQVCLLLNMGIIFVLNCNECIWPCLARKLIFKHCIKMTGYPS